MLGLPPGWAVSANGAVVVTYPPFEVRHEVRFDPSDVVRQVAAVAPHALIGVQDLKRWRVSRPFPDGELQGEVLVQSIDELSAHEVSRVVVREPNSSEQVFAELVAKLGLHEVSYFVGWSAWLDIGPRGVDKAHGLAMVCDDLSVDPADVLALGDGRNDIEMLQWAGRGGGRRGAPPRGGGVAGAIGDAPEEVKRVADAVTGGFADLGTVEELDRWFPPAP
jgi:hydroxymethylpyrimidine pyrophosphatase-like HAD family hydrolase